MTVIAHSGIPDDIERLTSGRVVVGRGRFTLTREYGRKWAIRAQHDEDRDVETAGAPTSDVALHPSLADALDFLAGSVYADEAPVNHIGGQ